LVSEVTPAGDLMERALWVASAIASQPVVAVQGSMRAAWSATETGRQNALSQVSAIVTAGTTDNSIKSGEGTFQGGRIDWQLR